MSKKGYISRYLLILKKLKSKPYSTYEELQGYIENQLEFFQTQDYTLNIGFSKRTLQRDLREIRNIFGIDIEYSSSEKGYFIIQNDRDNMNFQRMIESFDVFNSLNLAQDSNAFIHLDKQKPQGTEHLYGILHAIRNKLQIRFSYHKFWDDEPTLRHVEPYVVKEFKSRWYLIANDRGDKLIKTFALDRISELEITTKSFEFVKSFDVENHFKYSYGIISPIDEKPKEIILSFEPFQGKYIKSLPLHETQEVLIDNKIELRIKLHLFITHDFVMELLSFGDSLKVISPTMLVREVKKLHQKAFKRYK